MTFDQLKPHKILRAPLFAEPVEVLVTVSMGDAVKLLGPGLQTLDWQPIVKVEHYRLKQDSIRHPVELKEPPAPYRAQGSH